MGSSAMAHKNSGASTLSLNVAIGDSKEFIDDACQALTILENLHPEAGTSGKRCESGIGDSSTVATPEDLFFDGTATDKTTGGTKEKRKKKKKSKKEKTANKKTESVTEEPVAEKNIGGSSDKTETVVNSEVSLSRPILDVSDTIRLAEADKLAAEGTAVARSGEPNALPRAIQLLSSAIALHPHRAGYYGNRSLCFFKLGDYATSLNDAELAVDRDPENLKYLNRKAQALVQLKRQSDARVVAERMLELCPGNEVALQILNEIRQQLVAANWSFVRSSKDNDICSGGTISCSSSSSNGDEDDLQPAAIQVTNLPSNCTPSHLRNLINTAGLPIFNMKFDSNRADTATVFVSCAENGRRAVETLNGYVMDSKVLNFKLL